MERWPENFLPPSIPHPECFAWPLAWVLSYFPTCGATKKRISCSKPGTLSTKFFCKLCHSTGLNPHLLWFISFIKSCYTRCCSWHHIWWNSVSRHFPFFLLLVLFSYYAILFLDLAGDLLINYHILNRAIHLSWICLHFILWPNAQQLFKYQIITIPLSWFKTFPPLILPDCAFNVLN